MKTLNTIAVFVVMMLLCNMTEAAFADGAQGAHTRGRRNRNPVKRFGQFIARTFGVTAGAWVRSLLFAIIATVCVGFGPIMSAKMALFFTVITLGFVAYALYWWVTDGNRFIEAVFMALVICLLSVSAATVAARAVAVTSSIFWASVIRWAPAIVALLVCGYIFVSLTWEARQIWEKVLGGIIASVLILIAVALAIFSIRWAALLPVKADDDNTGAAPVQLAPQTSETVEGEEGLVLAEEPTEGPDYGTTEHGVYYDYREYNDRYLDENGAWVTPKVKGNAFGYDYSNLWGDEDATKEAIISMADREPEALAFYSFDFFDKDEKKTLGINGVKVGTDFRMGNYAGIDANFDKEGGGDLQEDLFLAFAEEMGSNRVRLNFVEKTGLQKTGYIYHKDDDGDTYVIPSEAYCCYDDVRRDKSKQVEVQRWRPSATKAGDGKWETVMLLNMDCGFQPCWEKAPKGVPKVSEIPTASGNNPSPTPDPGPGPGPGGNPEKDPTKEVKTPVNQPNTDKNSAGKDTNNGVGAKESTAEPDTSKGDAPSSTDMTHEQFEKKTKETAKEVKEQEKRNDATPTVKPKEGTHVDQTGEKKSAQPTTEKVPTATVNGETVAKQGEHVTGEIEIPK